MKKLVPDPPQLSPEKKAIRQAGEHLENAIFAAAALLALHNDHHQGMLNDALVEMRMSRALLMVAATAPPESGPV